MENQDTHTFTNRPPDFLPQIPITADRFVSIRVIPAYKDRLKRLSEERRTTITKIVMNALDAYLAPMVQL